MDDTGTEQLQVGRLAYIIYDLIPYGSIAYVSVLVSILVFMALSTVFHSINSSDSSSFSDSVLPVLSLPYWSFQLYISL